MDILQKNACFMFSWFYTEFQLIFIKFLKEIMRDFC